MKILYLQYFVFHFGYCVAKFLPDLTTILGQSGGFILGVASMVTLVVVCEAH